MISETEYKDKIIELERKKEYQNAYQIVKEALSRHPANLFFLASEIYILYKLRLTKEARELAEGSMEILKGSPFFLKTYLAVLEEEKAESDIKSFIENRILNGVSNDEDLYLYAARLAERLWGNEFSQNIIKSGLLHLGKSEKLLKALFESGEPNRYKYYGEKFKGMDINSAISEIEEIRVLPEYAKDYDLHKILIELYKKKGDYEKAITLYKYLLTWKEDEFISKMLGYAYYKICDMENALFYLSEPFKKNPFDHFISTTIFSIFKKKRDLAGYDRLINGALAINPKAVHLYGLLKKAQRWKKD